MLVNLADTATLFLADCLRRLSQALLIQYALAYPSDHLVVEELLQKDRVRLLDSPLVWNLLTEELRIETPSGQWNLAQRRGDWELVFRSLGSSFTNEIDRMLLGLPGPSKLIAAPDVSGLFLRLMTSESVERVTLPGFIEFLKRGGRVADLRVDDVGPFLRVMEDARFRFQFPPLGINMLRADHLDILIRAFPARGSRPISFTSIVAD